MQPEDFIFLKDHEEAMRLVVAWGHLHEQGLRVPGPVYHSYDVWAELALVDPANVHRLAPTLFSIEAITEDGGVDDTALGLIRGWMARQLRLPPPRRPETPKTPEKVPEKPSSAREADPSGGPRTRRKHQDL